MVPDLLEASTVFALYVLAYALGRNAGGGDRRFLYAAMAAALIAATSVTAQWLLV
jgi:hypothetical protein